MRLASASTGRGTGCGARAGMWSISHFIPALALLVNATAMAAVCAATSVWRDGRTGWHNWASRAAESAANTSSTARMAGPSPQRPVSGYEVA
jgi:hypothetical protein